MSDAGEYEGTFHFTLNGRCNFQEVHGLPDIQLETKDNQDGTKSVQGFIIRVKSSSEEGALNTAKSQAKRLVDILAVSCGGHLGYTLSGQQISTPDGRNTLRKRFRVRYDIISWKPVDLSKGNITKAIKTREPKGRDLTFVQSLGYANEGLGAYSNELYQVMIKQFHLALGDRPEARKYDSIRDAVSHHQELESRGTKQRVENDFPGKFVWTTNDTLDYSSDKTKQSLREIALEIMNIALQHIRKSL
jgi:hypothetical protein